MRQRNADLPGGRSFHSCAAIPVWHQISNYSWANCFLPNDSLSVLPASKLLSGKSGEVKENITGLTWFLRDLTWLFKKSMFPRKRGLGIYTDMHFVHRPAQFFSKLTSDAIRGSKGRVAESEGPKKKIPFNIRPSPWDPSERKQLPCDWHL